MSSEELRGRLLEHYLRAYRITKNDLLAVQVQHLQATAEAIHQYVK